MAGFLDKNSRIIDMVLTGEGKALLAKGDLNFVYWTPFDVEIDYDPYMANSGSLTTAQLSASIDTLIENAPIREATTGYKRLNSKGLDTTNVSNPLFTVPQGHRVIPRMKVTDGPTGSIDIEVKQRKVSEIFVKKDNHGKVLEKLGPYDRGFERFDTSIFTIEHGYSRGGFPADHVFDGFVVKILRSGSNGLVDVSPSRDMSNNIAFNNDLRLILSDNRLGDVEDE